MKNQTLIRAPKLSNQVASFLMGEIRTGRIKPGDKLPSENKLAETIGVSRTIIREALVRLEHDGLLESRVGSRTKVADPIKRTAFRIEDSTKLSETDIKHIYELRAILETAAALAAGLIPLVDGGDVHTSRVSGRAAAGIALHDAAGKGALGTDGEPAGNWPWRCRSIAPEPRR